MSRAALQELLSTTASAILRDGACAPLQSPLVRPAKIEQGEHKAEVVCAAGTFNYLRVERENPGCAVSSARVLRQGQDMEVLLLEPAHPESAGTWQALAVWSPPEEAEFMLELLAVDGTVCERRGLTLAPGGTP